MKLIYINNEKFNIK